MISKPIAKNGLIIHAHRVSIPAMKAATRNQSNQMGESVIMGTSPMVLLCLVRHKLP